MISTKSDGPDPSSDLTGAEFARILSRSLPHYPVSDTYERAHLPGSHWWSSQKEHVTAWLSEIDGRDTHFFMGNFEKPIKRDKFSVLGVWYPRLSDVEVVPLF